MENDSENLLSSIYGDVEVCTKEEMKKMKIAKMAESEMLSNFTMDFSKKFTSWW